MAEYINTMYLNITYVSFIKIYIENSKLKIYF